MNDPKDNEPDPGGGRQQPETGQERGRDDAGRPRRRSPVLARLVAAVIALVLLAAGGFSAWWFNATEGRAERTVDGAREAARVVEVVAAERGDSPVLVRAMGTVRPALEAVMRPRVAGMITEQHESFVPGGYFAKGTGMVQIDRADYEQALLQRKSELAQAQAALQIELGDQAVAREELELLKIDIPEINRELILRIPQVNQAKAQVRIAEAAVQRAELDLERTEITAPFDGHVVSRAVTVGNNVAEGTELARFVGDEEYWIELAVPASSLRWIEVPRSPEQNGSLARVRYPRVWGEGVHREGRVAQSIARLEEGSRLAKVIVSVSDPMARNAEREGGPELLLDAFVDVEIEGRVLEDCFVVDRDLIREGDTVWVMGDEDRLVTKAMTIAFRGHEHAWVTAGLEDGDRLIRTNLQTPVDGMLLRLPQPETPPEEARDSASAAGGDSNNG